MKKIAALILGMLTAFSLTACGAPKQVPDQTIAWEVEDYLKDCGYGAVSEFAYETVHSFDDSTKTDTVDVTLSAEFPTASITTSYSAVYQYNKSSDLWTVIRGGNWAPVSVRSYRLDFTPESILSFMKEIDDTAAISEKSIFAEFIIHDPEKEAVDSGMIDSSVSTVAYCESADPDTAYKVFLKTAYSLSNDNIDMSKTICGIGENYHYLKNFLPSMDADVAMICQDNLTLLFASKDNESNEIMMQKIGFIPNMECEPFDIETDIKNMLYETAETYFESGDYTSAVEMFTALGNFRDSATRVEDVIQAEKAVEYEAAEHLLEMGEYDGAREAFLALGDFRDSISRAEEIVQAEKAVEYEAAEHLLEMGEYDEAREAFLALGDYLDCKARAIEAAEAKYSYVYDKATKLLDLGEYNEAYALLEEIGDKETIASSKCARAAELINAEDYRGAFALLSDQHNQGSKELFAILAKQFESEGDKYLSAISYSKAGDHETSQRIWKSVLAYDTIRAVRGSYPGYAVGILENGDVVGCGRFDNGNGANVSSLIIMWKNIVKIVARGNSVIGLKDDGTLIAAGEIPVGTPRDGWENIVDVDSGSSFVLCLKNDGTAVAMGRNDENQCDVQAWKDIVSITTLGSTSAGLKKDGTVVATGIYSDAVKDWNHIVKLNSLDHRLIGITAKGRVLLTDNLYFKGYDEFDYGQYDAVGKWTDIVDIDIGISNIVGLKSNGTVVAAGRNNYSQLDVNDWSGITKICCGSTYIVGLREDGTVAFAGNNDEGKRDVSQWKDITDIFIAFNAPVGIKKDGSVEITENTNELSDIRAIASWKGLKTQ